MKSKKLLIFIVLLGGSVFQSYAQNITLRIPDTTVVDGDTLELPVYADQDLAGHMVLSWQLEIGFNSTYLVPLGFIKEGTLSSAWTSIQAKTWIPGKVSIAAAGGTALSGTGKLIIIRFRCIKAGYTNLTFTDPSENLLNEGEPAVTLDNGSASIAARPVITVRPETGLLTTGEELQYSVLGGTPPYSWSVTVDSVATISNSGLLTAGKRGFTRIVAGDSEGIIDTSGLLEVRGLKLTIPDTNGWQANEISIPVNSTNVTGLNIVSGTVSLSYSQHVMDAVVNVETTGSLLEGTADIDLNTGKPGKVTVSFAGTAPLTGSGPLMFVRFMVSRNTGGGNIEIEDALFNENILATEERGYFTIDPLPNLMISPEDASLMAGETVSFTADGGFPPYAWSVNDPVLASIDGSGLMTALQGGVVFISVTDQIGATGQTGPVTIYDARVEIADTSAALYSVFDLPVTISEWPAAIMDASSLEATFTLCYPELEVMGIETTGSLTEGWYREARIENDSILHVAMAGSNTFSGPGTILFLQVRLTEEFTVMETAWADINHILLNEGSPGALSTNGSITGVAAGEDIALSSYTNLSDGCELPVPIQFDLTIMNNGGETYDPGDTLRAGLILPGEPPETIFGILESSLPPAGEVELTYLDTVDQSFTGDFGYILYADLEEDVNRNNDTIMEFFTIYGYPEIDLGERFTEVSLFPYLLDAGVGYDSYEWQDGSTGQTFSAPTNGQYWITVTLNECPGSDTINLVGVGINDPSSDQNDLQVFPNPGNGHIRIISESMHGWTDIELYNMLGTRIYNRRINLDGRLDHSIRLENPVSGPYLLKVNKNVRKIIIQ